MSYNDILAMPLRSFWSLNSQINRVRSEEILDQIDLFLSANMNCGTDMVKSLRDYHQKRMGDPMEFEKTIQMPSAEEQREGIQQLRDIFAETNN